MEQDNIKKEGAPDCSRHKKEVAGISDMKQLAVEIGDLHYEALAELLSNLKDKLLLDAAHDNAAGRSKIAIFLHAAANNIDFAHMHIETAWMISKPFMQNKP